jgi:hypothetical protein
LQGRLDKALKAYGTALFTFYEYFKSYEVAGFPPSLEDMQSTPELHDGGIGDENYTEQLIGAYFTMMQACRDLDRGRALMTNQSIKLIGAFEAWVAT